MVNIYFKIFNDNNLKFCDAQKGHEVRMVFLNKKLILVFKFHGNTQNFPFANRQINLAHRYT